MLIGIILSVWLLVSLALLLGLAWAARRKPKESATPIEMKTREPFSVCQPNRAMATSTKLTPLNSFKAT